VTGSFDKSTGLCPVARSRVVSRTPAGLCSAVDYWRDLRFPVPFTAKPTGGPVKYGNYRVSEARFGATFVLAVYRC